MMKRKIGRVFLAAGIIILLVALLLLFNTNSPWALITLALSIILNTIGLSALMVRSVRDGADDKSLWALNHSRLLLADTSFKN